jgi:invasion protein IalB
MSARGRANSMVLSALLTLVSGQAIAAPAPASAAPAVPPPAAAPAADPNAAPAPQFSVNQPFGDWAVRCALTTVKSPAPCDVIQLTVNQDTKQRIMSFSLAFVPSRDAYAMQVIVPTGVALTRGMTIGTGDRPLTNVKYNRCERDGCYVEMLVDTPTIAAMGAAGGDGKSTNVTVISYGQFNDINLPVSLTGFQQALDRMRMLARERAVALPATTPTPPPASGTPIAQAAPAPAAAAAPAPRGAAAPAPAAPGAAGRAPAPATPAAPAPAAGRAPAPTPAPAPGR